MAVWEIRTHSNSLFYRIFENYTSDFPHFSKNRHFAPAWDKSRDTFVHCDMRCLCTGFARALPGLCMAFLRLCPALPGKADKFPHKEGQIDSFFHTFPQRSHNGYIIVLYCTTESCIGRAELYAGRQSPIPQNACVPQSTPADRKQKQRQRERERERERLLPQERKIPL